MKESQWTKLSSLAEVISSLAIVITLIYLAIQTQQNSEATLTSSRQTIINNDLALIQALIDYPEIPATMRATKESYEKLADIEKTRAENWLIALSRAREHQWFQYHNNLLDQRTWDAYLTGLSTNLSYPLTRGWWNLVAYDYFDDEFVDEVNEYLINFPINLRVTPRFDEVNF